MGLMDTIKRRYDLRQVNKYTQRRMSQSQFESRDKDYYDAIYMDGAYLQNRETENSSGNSGHGMSFSSISSSSQASSVHRPERWSLPSFLQRGSRRQESLATKQTKTSESYTLNG
ncbi:hypothetical protein BCR42DRAFT_408688 [Absidia repens]|uniref:Uncharacterized protein n=1 Tax=Absidia repens TaxID=90262 RepID=A0A1X2IQ52_9FUNG|nr:hypothetical protein BCR42DRAFT_408688 [Absidia repens]